MATNKNVNASEEQSRELMESSREANWSGKGFLRNLFLGDLRVDWIDPWPETPLSAEFQEFYAKLEAFIIENVDSVEIDATGEIPKDVLKGLADMGAFGIKIPKKYGGLGFNNVEYCKAMELIGQYDGNLVALLSAHQSIGVPQPVKLFGTEEQKQKYLPPCAKGAVSAFALTEPDVGSDPARLGTTCVLDESGENYIINGEKLWITNSIISDFLVVMARNPDDNKISALIVECDWEGVEIAYRCRFMGLKALYNGVVRFNNVKVPKENLLGKEGAGLKIAFVTLNAGRLSIPAAVIGGSKAMLEESRRWATERVQWGLPVGKHEIISHMLADMAADVYGLETLSNLATELSQREGYDIRLEASAAKEWCTVKGWDIIDDALQIKGGRGYETEASLAGRGERAVGIERMMRDSRINRIFEGSSEVMHLFMARELVDKHLKVAGVMLDPKAPILDKVKALPSIAAFYAVWYPKLWLGWLWRPSYAKFGKMAGHLRFAEAASRKLARTMFHGMMLYQAKLERKQAFMFRAVDIAMQLFVLVAMVVRTQKLLDRGAPEAQSALELTDSFARNTKSFVGKNFKDMWSNNDDGKYAVGVGILDERLSWLEPKSEYTPTAPASGEETEAAAK